MTRRNLAHGTTITVGINMMQPSHIANEELLRAHAQYELHVAVKGVLDKLGIQGEFTVPGGCSATLIGDPDFSWIQRFPQSHPKLVVRVVSTFSSMCVPRPDEPR
jgi:hypothetical protein